MAVRDAARPAKPARVNVSKVIRSIGKRSPSARSSNAIGFWSIGDEILQLREGGGRGAVSRLSENSRLCARELRYCVAVRKAFELDRLQALFDRGMTWSTIRVLAAEHLASHRDRLIEHIHLPISFAQGDENRRIGIFRKQFGISGDFSEEGTRCGMLGHQITWFEKGFGKRDVAARQYRAVRSRRFRDSTRSAACRREPFYPDPWRQDRRQASAPADRAAGRNRT